MTIIGSVQSFSSTAIVGSRPVQSDVRVAQETAAQIVGSELRGPYVGAERTAALASLWPIDAVHGGGLLVQARANGGALAAQLGVSHDPVAVGQLERAALDFGREARALFIGGVDQTPAQLTQITAHALDAAAAHAAALPDVGLAPVDRAVALLEHATHTLADAPHSLLAPPSNPAA